MRNLLQVIPIPISGLMLAFISLGNLLLSMNQSLTGHFFFFIGILLFILIVGKILFAFSSVVKEMQNPIIASVSPTFTMGTLSISNGLHYYGVQEVFIHTLWIAAATLQIGIILYFIKTFVWKNKVTISQVFPSWLILFVGTAVMPLTAGNLSGTFTKGVLIFAVCAIVILVPIIILRGFIRKDLPEPTIPMLTILTAPASLCLAAYFKQFEAQLFIVVTFFIVAQLLYLLVLTKLPSALKLPFYPSYAAFTFPLVISATATNAVIHYFEQKETASQWLTSYFYFQLTFSSVIVLYVLIRYINYLTVQLHQKRAIAAEKKEAIS
ncbi:TDT family transporter [Solibacillus merdavium]|uniref:TDT family transporter n=1 Tax=Solibacillus merdavium TaxID=2762218 RepID=A0ABR8XLR6_9BACL|nr:TDT family transporter [Solibacillus merdavium]MBD8032884.1 TDT family transporter [Solibacillus merdavium]